MSLSLNEHYFSLKNPDWGVFPSIPLLTLISGGGRSASPRPPAQGFFCRYLEVIGIKPLTNFSDSFPTKRLPISLLPLLPLLSQA